MSGFGVEFKDEHLDVMESDSSGYISFQAERLEYDNNVSASREMSSKHGRGIQNSYFSEPATRVHDNTDPSAQYNRLTPGVHLSVPIVENVYHRIHKYDSDGRFKPNQQIKRSRQRPLPSIPGHGRRQVSAGIKRRPRLWIRITIVLLGLSLIVIAGHISIKLTCFEDLFCPKENEEIGNSTTLSEPIPVHPCNMHVIRNYSEHWQSTCFIEMNNTQTLMFTRENSEPQTYILDQVTKNITLGVMTIAVTRSDLGVRTDFGINEVNCSSIGLYYVKLANLTHNETFVVNVSINPDTLLCPCTRQSVVQKQTYIECQTSSSTNISVSFRNDSYEYMLYDEMQIEDLLVSPKSHVNGTGTRVSAFRSDLSVSVRLEFPIVSCSHAGLYIITLLETNFETTLSVKSYPGIPTIDVYHEGLGGLVESETGQIRCEAFVGCGTSAPILYEKIFDEYQPIRHPTTNRASGQRGITYNVTFEIEDINFQSINGTQYMCSFTVDDKSYESDVFTALVIPGTYCDNSKPHCNKKHPYDCSKFITCIDRAWERLCGPGLYFVEDDCQGMCDWVCPYEN